ncbi:MAG TPA: tellurite resistance TerB family protein [Leptolyngbyaceae cyanobacterium]
MGKGKYEEVFSAEGQSEQTLSPEEAVVAIVFVAMFANNDVNDEDLEYLSDMLSSLEIFDNYSTVEMQEVLDDITSIYDEEGIGVLFNTAVASISDELVETAFESAVEVVLVDDSLSEESENFLFALQKALAIPEEIAQEIIDDLVIVED